MRQNDGYQGIMKISYWELQFQQFKQRDQSNALIFLIILGSDM